MAKLQKLEADVYLRIQASFSCYLQMPVKLHRLSL
jgi:hypothetical protein